ncbi:MAG: helix-turn-helix transcriptional regulator [Vicinamibacterales bacterium]
MRNDLPRLIGTRVRELRQAAGISQEELAERADLHRNYISSVERGQRDVGVGALHRIATALGTSLAEFFKPFGRPKS